MSSQNDKQYRLFTELKDSEFEIHGHTLYFILTLFGVVLAVTLLFLYCRSIFRRHNQGHLPGNQGTHAPHAPPQRARGLNPTIIKALPITLYQKNASSSSSGSCSLKEGSERSKVVEMECCSICLGVFEDGDKINVLPICKHYFHSQCVDRWLRSESSCPLCRALVIDDSAAFVSIPIH